jgi:hypothetical protein
MGKAGREPAKPLTRNSGAFGASGQTVGVLGKSINALSPDTEHIKDDPGAKDGVSLKGVIKMKNLLVIGGILFAFASSSVAAGGLDKEEREEYVACEKVAWMIDEYAITWVDQAAWNETRELYRAEMSGLQLNKAEKEIKKETRKMKTVLDRRLQPLPEYVPEEHEAYIIFAGLLVDDKARDIFYRCF